MSSMFFNGDWIDEPYMKNAYTANEETINRWIVNYIRHKFGKL